MLKFLEKIMYLIHWGGQNLLDRSQKVLIIREKKDGTSVLIKIKKFCLSKDSARKMKR